MLRRIGLAALIAALGLAFVAASGADPKKNDTVATSTGSTQTTSINNGGGTPNCGNSCDPTHNPTDFHKPCDPVPGNGCHTLPDTPCERGHNGTEVGNKHCLPGLSILKEQRSSSSSVFTHDSIDAPVSTDIFYRITVTNNTSMDYTLTASDTVCADNINGHDLNNGQSFDPIGSTPQSLPAGGEVQYFCDIDALPGQPGISGQGPSYTLTNTVNATASPVVPGSDVLLTDTVTANLS